MRGEDSNGGSSGGSSRSNSGGSKPKGGSNGARWMAYLGVVMLGVGLAGDVVGASTNCDRTIVSNLQDGRKSGVFQSPGFPSQYPNSASCTFKFIGMENERVKITFDTFRLQGRSPSCERDYVHLYSQLESEKDDLLEAKITGPFCGSQRDNLPKMVVSTNHILVIWFHSNDATTNKGFNGTWEFINGEIYAMGTETPSSCGYTIRSEKSSRGYIFSDTYPGMYPDNLFCHYNLVGKPGQRIKIVLEDFWLFYGGEYCPFDFLRIFDGPSVTNKIIATLCGTYNSSTVLYSSGHNLRLNFVTGEGRLEVDDLPMQPNADYSFVRKGFNISYEFSDKFVTLDHDFIRKGSEHVRGTECDLRIMSQGENNGSFVSPGFPNLFREGVVCRFFLDGYMNEKHLEKVKVNVSEFSIPGNMPYCLLGYLGQNEDGRLSDGLVKTKYCGELNPPTLTSVGPRMVLTLNTTNAVRGGRFSAHYHFIPDFDIPGESIKEGQCSYGYKSESQVAGYIQSPRHPDMYPPGKICEYIFLPKEDETIVVTIPTFKLSNEKSPPCMKGDALSYMEDLAGPMNQNFTLTETYCGEMSPGPYVTSRALKMLFRSDDVDSYVGFKADYVFVKTRDMDKSCRTMRIPASGSGGTIISPNYPKKYPPLTRCEWIIQASKVTNRILVQLSDINIEGKYGREGRRPDCGMAALRLYTDSMAIKPVAALCGKVKDSDPEVAFVSQRDTFKISFVSSPNSLGDKGFKISWTEILEDQYMPCEGFKCATNDFCISPGLKCNKEPNCGEGDDSDETAECPQKASVQILHIAIGTSIASFFCITLLICAFYHRRKFRTERAPPDHDHVEVRYVSAPTGCNTTDRLLMEDRNDAALAGTGVAYHQQEKQLQQQQQQHHQQYPYNHEKHTNGGSHNNMNNAHGTGAPPTTNNSTSSSAAAAAAANTQSPRCQKVSMV